MQVTLNLHTDELNDSILESIRQQFGDAFIRVEVRALDETEYLNSSQVNRDRLLETIADIEAGENLVAVDNNSKNSQPKSLPHGQAAPTSTKSWQPSANGYQTPRLSTRSAN